MGQRIIYPLPPSPTEEALTDIIAKECGSQQVFQDGGGQPVAKIGLIAKSFSVPEYAAVLVRNKIPSGIGNHNSGVDR